MDDFLNSPGTYFAILVLRHTSDCNCNMRILKSAVLYQMPKAEEICNNCFGEGIFNLQLSRMISKNQKNAYNFVVGDEFQ